MCEIIGEGGIMAKVLIIGAGPAGVSAALYARRGGMEVMVISRGSETGGLAKAHLIENYYGLEEAVSGAELARRGIEGAKRLGVEFIEADVLGLSFNESFTGFCAETKEKTFAADSVILAAGASRSSLAIPGIREFEGKGISYCAVCDAFFYRGKTAAVIGAGEYAVHEAGVLLPHAAKIILLTNGEELSADVPVGIEVVKEKLKAIDGAQRVERVEFTDGSAINTDGVFLALGTAGSTELARKMGIMLDGSNIQTDAHMATNIPGVFAAGDCTGGLLQVAKAVYEGAEAGLAAVKYLREKNG